VDHDPCSYKLSGHALIMHIYQPTYLDKKEMANRWRKSSRRINLCAMIWNYCADIGNEFTHAAICCNFSVICVSILPASLHRREDCGTLDVWRQAC
jgi:hypothetical protein